MPVDMMLEIDKPMKSWFSALLSLFNSRLKALIEDAFSAPESSPKAQKVAILDQYQINVVHHSCFLSNLKRDFVCIRVQTYFKES